MQNVFLMADGEKLLRTGTLLEFINESINFIRRFRCGIRFWSLRAFAVVPWFGVKVLTIPAIFCFDFLCC